MEYKPLESTTLSSLGVPLPTFNGDTSFYGAAVFAYTVCFIIIGAGAFYGLVQGGIWRMQASEEKIRMSNEKFKKVALGLAGTFGLFLLLVTLNKDLLMGDIGLGYLKVSAVSGAPISTASGSAASSNTSNSDTSKTCSSVDDVKAKMIQSGGVCGGTSCQVLSGCNYSQYQSIITSEANAAGVDPKMIIVTLCKESRGNANAQNKNPNGTYDCGLMQVNQSGPCTQNVLDPTSNIRSGVATMRGKLGQASQVYQNIPAVAGVFSSYNCCSNGTVPNSPSGDCTTQNGFPFTLPKWACPINPGDGQFNMCTVKNYTCELVACLNDLSG